MTVKMIERTVRRLSPVQRIRIVENILASLSEPNPAIERAWVAESERRFSDFRKGKIKAISWEDIKKRLPR